MLPVLLSIMEHYKFVQIISSKPELWDRCNAVFREPTLKEKVWKEVAAEMGKSAASCKDGFKHLREKYLREREKSRLLGDKYQPWDMIPYLTFLDSQIIPRKSHHSVQFYHCNTPVLNQESKENEYSGYCEMKKMEKKESMNIQNDIPENNFDEQSKYPTQYDFDRALVELVKQSHPLWDWKNNSFWNKQSRHQTWDSIAKKLNKTSSECLLRWKALREKYIREKAKHKENYNCKWELLDTMSFLDRVIQYRKCSKNNNQNFESELFSNKVNRFANGDFLFSGESSTSNADYHYQVIGDDNSLHEPPTDFLTEVKQEVSDVPDSSYDSEGSSKKRRLSINSVYSLKKQREEKSPEELFGELVASLLTRKSESDRHTAMVEIMKVLAK